MQALFRGLVTGVSPIGYTGDSSRLAKQEWRRKGNFSPAARYGLAQLCRGALVHFTEGCCIGPLLPARLLPPAISLLLITRPPPTKKATLVGWPFQSSSAGQTLVLRTTWNLSMSWFPLLIHIAHPRPITEARNTKSYL